MTNTAGLGKGQIEWEGAERKAADIEAEGEDSQVEGEALEDRAEEAMAIAVIQAEAAMMGAHQEAQGIRHQEEARTTIAEGIGVKKIHRIILLLE
jgi:hypothetical protein